MSFSKRIGSRIGWVALCVLVAVVVALVVTDDLSCRREYEVRYEFRVRDYVKNVVGPERMLAGISRRDSHWLYGYLESLPAPEGLSREVRFDKSEKIVLRVRGNDSAMVSAYGVELYGIACDTITRYGDEVCARMVEVLQAEISALPMPETDSLQSLQKELYEMLAVLKTESAGELKYVSLINAAELPQAHLMPSRCRVVLLSGVVALLFGLSVVLLKEVSRLRRNEGE